MRAIHVCTAHGVSLPGLEKAAASEIQAGRQLAKGRRKAVDTNVSRYVTRKAPALARALREVLSAHAKRMAGEVKTLAADLLKDETSRQARILRIIEEMNADGMGVDLENELEPAMLEAFKRAAAIGATQVGMSLDDMTDQVDQAAVDYAEKHGGELIKDLADTTEDALRVLLADAIEEGLSVDDLSDRLEELGAFSDYRAELIARTELARAHVQGNVAGWRESGQVEGKRWLLADTHEVADECDDAADAEVVDLDEDFVDGIDFPPAHPGCLCDVLPVLRESDSDPSTDDEEGDSP